MGHRTNYILIEEGETNIYYSHWDAIHIADKMLYGPQPLVQYILSLDMVAELLDNVWAEAALVLDMELKHVLFWGDERMGSGQEFVIPYYIKMLEENTWEGWKIKYAYREQVEIAEYIGIDPFHVMNKTKNEILESEILAGEYGEETVIGKQNQQQGPIEASKILDELLEEHLKNLDYDPTTPIRRIIEEYQKKGEEIEVNPYALHNKPFLVEIENQVETIEKLTDWIYNLRETKQ